jgi:hypothetical protein
MTEKATWGRDMGIATKKKIIMHLLVLVGMGTGVRPAYAIPAFARKYGLPCSACHEAWPKLNNFGQVFRDNGYQLGTDRDAPIYQDPSYWPITIRVIPQWHRESNNNVAVDSVPGDANSGQVDTKVIKSGFDFSAVDIWTAGTLHKNISFAVETFINNTGGTF